jgi:hypothetical protein
MNDPEVEAVICEVARDIVADIAPQELPIFPAVSGAYFANPSTAMKQRKKEAGLGFGAEALSALLTPVVLFVLTQVVAILGETAKKVATDELAKGGTAVVRMIFRKFDATEGLSKRLPLLESQRTLVRQKIMSMGRDFKLSDETLSSLAEAVVAQLAVPE